MAEKVVYRQTPLPPNPELKIESEWQLASGVQILPGELRAVFNRLRLAAAPQFAAADASDRAYAAAELGALWVSWLQALQGNGVFVANPPSGGALQPALSRTQWLKLAWQAGFTLPPAALEGVLDENNASAPSTQRWLAAGERLVPLGSPLGDPRVGLDSEFSHCLQVLQQISGCPLLELVVAEPDGAVFEVSAFPQTDHPDALTAIAAMLEASAQ